MTARASARGGADRLDSAAASSSGVVAWYAQGFADRLGDRLLLFDNTGAAPLELLRVAERLTGDPAFEPALRERVEELKPFRHPAFARVRGVSVLAEPTPQLALVSEHIPGERLSQILRAARAAGFRPDPGTALWLVRQLMPAVAALHEMGAEIAHGTLSPDRIIVTPAGDLVVTEYVFAHAIDRLGARPADLWRELGVAVGPGSGRIDQRGDIEQVALLALAVLLGRPLAPHEYPHAVRGLLDEACNPLRWSLVPPLRAWLDRAFVLDAPAFGSAAEALETLDALLPRVTGMWAARLLPQNLPGAASVAASETGSPPPPRTAALLPRDTSGPARDEAGAIAGDNASDARPSSLSATHPVVASAGFPEVEAPTLEPAPAVQTHASPLAAAAAAPGESATTPSWNPRGIFFAGTPTALESPDAGLTLAPVESALVRRLWMLCATLAVIALLEALCLIVLLTSR